MKLQVGKRYKGEFLGKLRSLKIHSIYELRGEIRVKFSWDLFSGGIYHTQNAEDFKSSLATKEFKSIEI